MGPKAVDFETAFQWIDAKIEKLLDKKDSVGLDGLERRERMTYLIYSYDTNVRNGGIMSFLDHQNGNKYEDLISFLQEIGAGAVANDLNEVVAVLKSANAAAPLSLRVDLDKFNHLPIADQFKEIEARNTVRYYEYEPGPLQLLYRFLKKSS